MDEHEYLALLQRLYGDPVGAEPTWTDDELRWSKARAEQFADPPLAALPSKEEARRFRSYFLQNFLVDPILKVLPPEDLPKLADVPIGIINVRSLNAQAFRAPNGRPVITINQGLLSLISYWWEMKASNRVVMADRGQRASQQLLIDAYSFLLLYYRDNGRQPYPWRFVPMDMDSMFVVLICSMQTELFVIAHEMSHVILGHPIASPDASHPPDREQLARQSELPRSQEHEADVYGYLLYLNAWGKSELGRGRLEAVDFFAPLEYFALRSLIEKNPEIVPPSMDVSHPTAIDRAQVIISRIAGMKLSRKLRRELKAMTREFSGIIETTPNLSQYYASLVQEAKSIIERIEGEN